MTTRSITRIIEDGEVLVAMYRQCDGYPEGHGVELFEFLKDIKLVRGIPRGDTSKMASGADCLAAQMVAHFKKGIGDFYVVGAHTAAANPYRYDVIVRTAASEEEPFAPIHVRVELRERGVIFMGTVSAFGAFVEAVETEE